ncbi:hypothetical protein OQA88_11259 [Cercophora sp. LCS_1]
MKPFFFLALAVSLVHAVHHFNVKRHTNELSTSYDFVIVGGGTCGLTLADRLTEHFPQKQILVVEYGDLETARGRFDPPNNIWGSSGGLNSSWTINSTPSPALNNNTALVIAAKVVGGGTVVNAAFFDRGSRFDYDAWDQLQGDVKTESWNWEAIYPWFKKSVTFTPPPPEVVSKIGYTWDMAAFGNTTPIHASFPAFQFADHQVRRDAWIDMGIQETRECADGTKEGLCWIPNSQHPVTAIRSHSGLGHYLDVRDKRPNYHLLLKHQVVRVIYRSNDLRSGPPIVELRSTESKDLFNISATKEVILSAGAFNSPAILQRSGIGPAPFLKKAGIPVLLDLPGVGSNLHDHSGPSVDFKYIPEPVWTSPMPSDMLNETFEAIAAAAFRAVPATGPYTLAASNSAAWISLPNTTADSAAIISKIWALATSKTKSTDSLFLPPEYEDDPTLLAGYQAQLHALANLLSNPHAPNLESPHDSGTRVQACLLHPLSRGTVRLNLTNSLDFPVLDYRSASNPIDIDMHVANVRYVRKKVQSGPLKKLGAVETAPGLGVQSDEELVEYVKNRTTQSFMHPTGTSAMLPLDKGGVVDTKLKVYGAAGLRVVDAGVFPILISAHLSATAYAFAEKAADLIIREWDSQVQAPGVS